MPKSKLGLPADRVELPPADAEPPNPEQEPKPNRRQTKKPGINSRVNPQAELPHMVQPSPPLTAISSRNASGDQKRHLKGREGRNSTVEQEAEPTDAERSSKRARQTVAKRKPKRPLVRFLVDPFVVLNYSVDTEKQLFEDTTSSLPATQIIGESQSLGQRTQGREAADGGSGHDGLLLSQTRPDSEFSRPSSLNPFNLIIRMSLSPEAKSAIEGSHNTSLPQFPVQAPETQTGIGGVPSRGEPKGVLRLNPSSSTSSPQEQLTPTRKSMKLTFNDSTKKKEAGRNQRADIPSYQALDENAEISFKFSPRPNTRRASLFYDLPSSSVDED